MAAAELKCCETKQGRGHFAAYGSPHGKRGRHRFRFFRLDQIEQIDREYPDNLLKELGERGDRGLIFSVIIAVKAGMQTGKGQGKADDTKQWFAGRFGDDMFRQPRRIAV